MNQKRKLQSNSIRCAVFGLLFPIRSVFFRAADAKKNEGNEFHKTKQYKSAISSYADAISLDPQNFSLYGNRSASYMMLGQFSLALEDAKLSTSLNPNFIKVCKSLAYRKVIEDRIC